MPKNKKKPVELWPKWDSPERKTRFHGLPELKRSIYTQAGQGFTADNLESIHVALKRRCGRIQAGFDLLGRLQVAVYDYHLWSGGRRGEVELFDLLPESQKREKLETLKKQTKDLLTFCERNRRLIRFLTDDDEEVDCPDPNFAGSLCGSLRFLNRMAVKGLEAIQKKDGLETSQKKDGRGLDKARRVFYLHLLKAYEEATGNRATSTKDGPFFEFAEACYSYLVVRKEQGTSFDSILKHIKQAIRDRPLAEQYLGTPLKTPPVFSAQVVVAKEAGRAVASRPNFDTARKTLKAIFAANDEKTIDMVNRFLNSAIESLPAK